MPHCRDGSEQRKTGHDGKQQWQHIISEHHGADKCTEDGINQCDGKGVGRHGAKVIDAFAQRLCRWEVRMSRICGRSRSVSVSGIVEEFAIACTSVPNDALMATI